MTTVKIMTRPSMPRLEINGRAVSVETLWFPALSNYGHYTAMQVRNGKTRGLELHLNRLRAATRELFDTDLDDDRVREHIRHALGGDTEEASVFVAVFRRGAHAEPSIMVTVGAPAEASAAPQRLQSVGYQRPLAHIKHVGTFGQTHYTAITQRNGFDEALLTAPDGAVSEAAAANIGFFDGTAVVWPSAPALHGITVGVSHASTHAAPTPVGAAVTMTATLQAVDGKLLTFAVTAHDGQTTVLTGQHVRAVVNAQRFAEKLTDRIEVGDKNGVGPQT
jgi:hypothetical protein